MMDNESLPDTLGRRFLLFREIAEYIDLRALLAILQKSQPLPRAPGEVRPWLAAIGITGDAQDLAARALERLLGGAPVDPSGSVALPITYEVEAASAWLATCLGPQTAIDPERLRAIIELVIVILSIFAKNRMNPQG